MMSCVAGMCKDIRKKAGISLNRNTPSVKDSSDCLSQMQDDSMTDEETPLPRVLTKKHRGNKPSTLEGNEGSGSCEKLSMEMGESNQVPLPYSYPSSGRGCKTANTFNKNSSCSNKGKEKIVMSSKYGFDYLTCSQETWG